MIEAMSVFAEGKEEIDNKAEQGIKDLLVNYYPELDRFHSSGIFTLIPRHIETIIL